MIQAETLGSSSQIQISLLRRTELTLEKGDGTHCILIIKAKAFFSIVVLLCVPRGTNTPKQKSQLNSALEVVKVYEVEIFSDSSVLGVWLLLSLSVSYSNNNGGSIWLLCLSYFRPNTVTLCFYSKRKR